MVIDLFPPASNSRVISQSVKKRCVPFPPRILSGTLSPKFSLLLLLLGISLVMNDIMDSAIDID